MNIDDKLWQEFLQPWPNLVTAAHTFPNFTSAETLGDFKKDANQPEKSERYQAEALIQQMVPVNGLLGIVCYCEATETMIRALLADLGLDLKNFVRPTWYF